MIDSEVMRMVRSSSGAGEGDEAGVGDGDVLATCPLEHPASTSTTARHARNLIASAKRDGGLSEGGHGVEVTEAEGERVRAWLGVARHQEDHLERDACAGLNRA